ncbi:DeoR family transcriptional regulator [Ligilactobacillus equi DSM 15833 = JCM 10991]|uniref:Transcription regulator of fructose operon n=2 Tax=Ligilactobacillus equi TaxID=137357 RepID=V7HXR3_9LACO|nr:transcription regulator of fructose operon [Ligilactobacillus equi DPC 6820]KRL82329.1 DeoR family transcriptional regulator [Ligilactobacillus equi DSM 15833 = JCM 10991]
MEVLAEKRQEIILKMLKNDNIVKIQDICNQTACSESSARRDLQLLEEQGLLTRVHGGAKLKYSLQQELDVVGKSVQNTSEKAALAKYVATLIQENDVLYLDAGTTTLNVVDYLRPGMKVTVVTNGVSHASKLADRGIQTIVLGGRLKDNTKAVVGSQALAALSSYRFNKAIIGINGIHPQYGLTTPDPDEAALKRLAIEQSEQTFVLADASKFSAVSFVQIANLDQVEIVTGKLPAHIRRQYNNQTSIQEVFK